MVRLDCFQVYDPIYCKECSRETLLMVRSRYMHDSLYYGTELQAASICAIVGQDPHMSF